MIDNTIVTHAMQPRSGPFDPTHLSQVALLFGDSFEHTWWQQTSSSGFTRLHSALLYSENRLEAVRNVLEESHHFRTIADVIDNPDSRGRSALAWCVEYGWDSAAELLISYGSNVHQVRTTGLRRSPLLHLAIAGPSPDIPNSDQMNTIKLLLGSGVDVNATDDEGWTALHVAASWNLVGVIHELYLRAGPRLYWDSLTNLGKSVIDLAIDGGADELTVDHLQQCARTS